MGLAQKFYFEYEKVNDIEKILIGLSTHKSNNLWIISEYNQRVMLVECGIEDYGLYMHRSGDYFEIVGILVETLTGAFGKISSEDL
jgi:hypothetical protein